MDGEHAVKRLFNRDTAVPLDLQAAAARGRVLIEESPEIVLVLDEDRRLVAASRRAREVVDELEEGMQVDDALLRGEAGRAVFSVPYVAGDRSETLVYLRGRDDVAAYEELRAGFTAAVSHELRTPLARLLALLETAELPDADVAALLEQARREVTAIGELIDDVLFLSELETGGQQVGFEPVRAWPILAEVLDTLGDEAGRAGVRLALEGDEKSVLPLGERMLRVLATNLAENAIRYAGPGTRFGFRLEQEPGAVVLTAVDDGVGVTETDLERLFERFYRADRARASRGTGLGLAVVKHIVVAAGGTVEATGARGRGLTVRSSFPARTG